MPHAVMHAEGTYQLAQRFCDGRLIDAGGRGLIDQPTRYLHI